jgi:hypothetical protein
MSITDKIKEWTEGVPVEHSARQQLYQTASLDNGYFENLLSVDIRTFSSRGEALSHYGFSSYDAQNFISVKTLQPDTYLGDIRIDSEWESYDDD